MFLLPNALKQIYGGIMGRNVVHLAHLFKKMQLFQKLNGSYTGVIRKLNGRILKLEKLKKLENNALAVIRAVYPPVFDGRQGVG